MDLEKHVPKIFCAVGMIGAAMTAYLAAKETPKALRLIEEAGAERFTDAVKACWKCYIPAAASFLITCGSIAGAFSRLVQQNTKLALAYGVGQTALELYSQRSTPQERKEVAEQSIQTRLIPLDPASVSEDTIVLWKDYISGKEFKATKRQVKEAIRCFNEDYLKLTGEGSVNQFYEYFKYFSELDTIGEQGDNLGWKYTAEYPEVIPLIYSSFSKDALPCAVLDFVNPPNYDYDNKFA